MIDLYLKPFLIGQDPWDIEFLWQHMYRKTMAFGRKGIGMAAISAVDIALWDILGKAAKQPVFRLLGGRTKRRIPVYAIAPLQRRTDELAAEAKRYKDEGYKAMKLRFGWGPTDGAPACSAISSSSARSARRSAMTSTSWPTPTWAGPSTMPSECCRCWSHSICAGWKSLSSPMTSTATPS